MFLLFLKTLPLRLLALSIAVSAVLGAGITWVVYNELLETSPFYEKGMKAAEIINAPGFASAFRPFTTCEGALRWLENGAGGKATLAAIPNNFFDRDALLAGCEEGLELGLVLDQTSRTPRTSGT